MRTAAIVLLLLATQETKPTAVTFTRDVAPIVFANCTSCHRAGEVAPFPLVDYQDVKKRAKQLLAVVESRRMPPWKPVEGYGGFVGERRLKPADIDVLKKWTEQGCEEGDAKDLPPLPKHPEGWAFGEPDLVLTMAEPYTVPAEGQDVLRAFAIPLGLTEGKYVRALQYRPSNSRIVHHALFYLDSSGESRRKDEADPEPGFDGWKIGVPALLNLVGKWNPGAFSHPFPDGMGKEVRKNADLVMQVHFSPSGKPETEHSRLGLWFTKEPPRRIVMPLPLVNVKLDLPPGEKDLRVTDRIVLPVDIDVIGVMPHAHYLARECRIWAKDPEGKEIPLLWIKDWDFNWQEQYRYPDLIRLTRGTELNMLWTYDNTSSNPRNPANPPRRVRWGQQSQDEMAVVRLQIAPVNPADRMKLYFSLFDKPPQEK